MNKCANDILQIRITNYKDLIKNDKVTTKAKVNYRLILEELFLIVKMIKFE